MIKATDYLSPEAKMAAEQTALGNLLDAFTKEVGQKLLKKIGEGYTGWDNPQLELIMREKLLANLEKQDMVDVAALAMMLWNLHQK
jgi:hypothetical protein